jgi:type II secretory pathway component PulK
MNAHRRGSVLIVVMVVVFAIAAMVLTLGRQVRTQALTSANDLAAQKADAAERGAEAYVLSLLTDYKDTVPTLTETDFSAVQVGDAYFWIRRPDYGDTNNVTWGLLDEASKLPLNYASFDQLMLIPGMTDEIANGIVAWRGATTATMSSATGSTGTSSSSTTVLPGGTDTKNAPFETIDELMLIPGMTAELLYGTPQAADAPVTEAGSDSWWTAHGIADYLTPFSSVPNKAVDGTARINYNGQTRAADMKQLVQDKVGDAQKAALVESRLTTRRGAPPRQYESFLALADTIQLSRSELALIEDYVTNTADQTLVGKVNVNTAPREVLLALGGFTEEDVSTLISNRSSAITDSPYSLAWVYDTLGTSANTRMELAGPMLIARGAQYSADIVAASANGRGFRHVRIVVDTSTTPARIIYRRDLTDRGWPMDKYILDDLKAGRGVNGGMTATIQTTGTPAAGAR